MHTYMPMHVCLHTCIPICIHTFRYMYACMYDIYIYAEQQKRFLELSNRPTLALYMGFPEQLIPAKIKNQRLQPFYPPPLGKGVNPDPPRASKKSKDKLSNNKKETQSGLQGTLNEERQPQSREDQENIGTSESLMFFYELYNIENNMLALFNKLNDIEYTSGIVNLSKYILQDPEISVLSKGLGFCPTPGAPDIGDIIQDLDNFKRKTRIQLFFTDPNQGSKPESIPSGGPFEHRSFKLKSTFNPVGPFQLESTFHSIEQDLHRQKYKEPRKKNLTKEEYKGIKSLKNNRDIIIKPADKGSAVVILARESYINEGQRQLNDTKFYEKTTSNHTGEVINRINLHIHNMLQRGEISQNTCNYLTTDNDRTQQFYLLGKIHKDALNPPGRPIVSESGGPTEKISQQVDHFIGKIVPLSKSFVRDSTHLINILKDFTIQPGILLCTLDVTSLYTNIPHLEGIQSIKEMLAIHKPPDTLPHNSYIIELLELVLTNNHFEFNGEFYHQLSGTAMGTKLAPSYANLFMTKFEDKYAYTYPQQPLLWKRFIDDIFLI